MATKSSRNLIRLLWLSFFGFWAFLALYVWAVTGNLFGLFGGMPNTENLNNPKSELATEVFSADNISLGKYFRYNRSLVKFNNLSPNLIKALYATEDVRFDDHSGIDGRGTFAIFFYLSTGRKRGSSTITQQVAKKLFGTRELYDGILTDVPVLATLIAKTKEWVIAVKLERAYTKQEILEMYFNTVDFGSNTFGVKTAAKTFFGKEPSNLTVNEAAMLVGLLKAPSLYSPIYNKPRAIIRRNTVLAQMEKYDYITDEERKQWQLEPIKLKYKVESHNDGYATYFRAELKKDLIRFCRENEIDLYSSGLRVYTTIDSRMQRYAEAALEKHMKYLQARFFQYWKGRNPWVDENGKEIKDFIKTAAQRSQLYRMFLEQYQNNEDSAWAAMNRKVPISVFTYANASHEIDTVLSPLDSIKYYKRFLHASLMSMDPHTGYIKAWVGGINFKHFQYDHVRQGKRQVGSTFKPFLYTAALDNGYTPCYEMVDAPVTFYLEATKQNWTPKNFDGGYSGERMTLRKALAQSINSVAAGLLQKIGINTVVDYAKRLGIESPIDPVPSLVYGVSDVSLFEMVGAYSVFVNNGTWTKPYYITRIEDKNGNVLRKYTPEKKEVLNPETAYLMVHMLRGGTTERNGTSLGLYRLGHTLEGNEVGGKTGTTSNYSDGWYIGLTKGLVTGVWVGGDDRSIHFRTADLGQGSKMALPIWSYYMDAVYADKSTGITKGPFPKPATLSVELNCKLLKEQPQDSATQQNTLQQPSTNDLDL